MRGNPSAALALLDPYLVRHPADADALFLALRLLYDGKGAGRPVLSADGVDKLASLESREVLLAKTAGAVKASLSKANAIAHCRSEPAREEPEHAAGHLA